MLDVALAPLVGASYAEQHANESPAPPVAEPSSVQGTITLFPNPSPLWSTAEYEDVGQVNSETYTVISATAANAAGDYVVVWYGLLPDEAETEPNRLFARRFNSAGDAVGDAIVISEGQVSEIKVAMAADGGFVVAWGTTPQLVLVGGTYPAYVRRFGSDGSALGDAIEVSAGVTTLQSLALAADGSFAVGYSIRSYTTQVHPPYQVSLPGPPQGFLQRFDAAGARVGEPIALGVSYEIEIVSAIDGGLWVVTQGGTNESGLKLHRLAADGSSIGSPIQVNYLAGHSLSPSIARDAAGNFVVAWLQSVGDNHQIMAQRFDAAGSPLRNAIVVETGNFTSTRDLVSVAMDAEGNFVVGWSQPTEMFVLQVWPLPDTTESWARTYDAAGEALGASVRVSSSVGFRLADLDSRGQGRWIINFLQSRDYLPSSAIRSHVVVQAYEFEADLAVDLNGEPPGIGYEGNYIPGGSPVPVGNPQRLAIRSGDAPNLTSATARVYPYLPGDLLEVVTSGTPIAASYVDGVLTLSGVASAADYQQVLRTLTYRTTASRPPGTTVEVRVEVVTDSSGSETAISKISIHEPGRSSIAGRHIFYNNSSFDAAAGTTTAADDAAIATDKAALLPGQTATFANYTSYTRGINGIMIDLAGEHGTITADDFIFRVGNSSDTKYWGYAPEPSWIEVRPGAGVGGSDRVQIIWPDGAIQNLWLQVIVLDNGNTGLAESDTFFFGNAVGETGNEPQSSRVSASDALRVLNQYLRDPQSQSASAIDSPLDFNRDGRIRTADLLAAVNQILRRSPPLERIWIDPGDAQSGAISAGAILSISLPTYELTTVVPYTADPQAAVFHDWEPEEESVDAVLAASEPSVLMLEPDDL